MIATPRGSRRQRRDTMRFVELKSPDARYVEPFIDRETGWWVSGQL